MSGKKKLKRFSDSGLLVFFILYEVHFHASFLNPVIFQ